MTTYEEFWNKCSVLLTDKEITLLKKGGEEKQGMDKILQWVEDGSIPEEQYKELAEENRPLPNKLYINPVEGEYWAQTHFRGLEPEDVESWKDNEISFNELIEGHSLHLDLRLDYPDKFPQYVVTESSIDSYIRVLKGETDPSTGNVQKGKIIIKPSAEPEEKKAEEDMLIDEEGAKQISKYVIHDKSFFLQPGEVGSTPYKAAYLGYITGGTVKSGLARPDVKEIFLTPDDSLPSKNRELGKGRFLIRAFSSQDTWWIWKAIDNPLPMDPIEHATVGEHMPKTVDDLDKFGHEEYLSESKEKFKEKLE